MALMASRSKILKFRTMIVVEDGDSVKQASRLDKRVTRVGFWLRRTSIDELPQLIKWRDVPRRSTATSCGS